VATPVEGEDEWTHPLIRRQRLTLEQSLLVAILRQQFVAHEIEAGIGAAGARMALEDLVPHLQAYLGDLGSDAQERKRLLTLLEQLKGHGLVSDVDQHERVTIRPIIVHLANPENLTQLIHFLRAVADAQAESGSSVTETEL
jgi:LPS sulfotransferase NodH